MSAKLTITSNECRLCGSSLESYEQERKLCSTCEEYTHQLGVRTEKEMEAAIADVLQYPVFKNLRQPAS